MALYCGIDLHSNNHVVVVIDTDDRRIVEKRLSNDLTATPFSHPVCGRVTEDVKLRYNYGGYIYPGSGCQCAGGLAAAADPGD